MSDPAGFLRIIVQELYLFREILYVFPLVEKAGLIVLNDFRGGASRASYNRLPREHRFHRHAAESLPAGAHEHHIRVLDKGQGILGIAVKRYARRHAEIFCLLYQLRAIALSIIPHQEQMRIDVPACQLRKRGDGLVLSFPWMQRSNDDALEK
jgi:hypothetical protein